MTTIANTLREAAIRMRTADVDQALEAITGPAYAALDARLHGVLADLDSMRADLIDGSCDPEVASMRLDLLADQLGGPNA